MGSPSDKRNGYSCFIPLGLGPGTLTGVLGNEERTDRHMYRKAGVWKALQTSPVLNIQEEEEAAITGFCTHQSISAKLTLEQNKALPEPGPCGERLCQFLVSPRPWRPQACQQYTLSKTFLCSPQSYPSPYEHVSLSAVMLLIIT